MIGSFNNRPRLLFVPYDRHQASKDLLLAPGSRRGGGQLQELGTVPSVAVVRAMGVAARS